MAQINVAIIGASGYTGLELIKILINRSILILPILRQQKVLQKRKLNCIVLYWVCLNKMCIKPIKN